MTAATDLRWPTYAGPKDIDDIELVPLSERGLPESTYAAVQNAARQWPHAVAYTVMPNGELWRQSHDVTYADLAVQVHQVANALRAAGIERGDAVGLLSTNTPELIPAVLAAQAAGIAAPVNPALRPDHISALLRAGACRVLIAAGPQVDDGIWERAREVAGELGLDRTLRLETDRWRSRARPGACPRCACCLSER